MTFILRRSGVALVLAMAALPALTFAQRGPGGRRGGPGSDGAPGPNPVAPIIGMRRELDLSARQLVALDSIERTLLRRNRDVMQRLQNRRDTLLTNQNPRTLTDDERAALRSRMQARRDSMQPLVAEIRRNDSTARAAALRVLTDSQRVRVREFQAERRGFARGRAMGARGPMDRQFGQRRGRMGGMGGGAMGPRGRFAPRDGMGLRGRFRAPPDDMAPRGQFGPGEMGPRGMGPGGMGPGGMGPGMGRGMRRGDMGPGMRDGMEPAPRRRPPPDSVPPVR